MADIPIFVSAASHIIALCLSIGAGSENFWPGVMYLVAGGLYAFAALQGYFISHFAVLNARDKRTKSFSVALFIFVMLLTILIVGKFLWYLEFNKYDLFLSCRFIGH